jgi:hypothetical protein
MRWIGSWKEGSGTAAAVAEFLALRQTFCIIFIVSTPNIYVRILSGLANWMCLTSSGACIKITILKLKILKFILNMFWLF